MKMPRKQMGRKNSGSEQPELNRHKNTQAHSPVIRLRKDEAAGSHLVLEGPSRSASPIWSSHLYSSRTGSKQPLLPHTSSLSK